MAFMDPLSISSGIAGLVALADSVFRAATRYLKSAKGAPTEAFKLLEEVKGFSVLLHDLSLVAYGLETDLFPEKPMEPAHEFQAYHLYGCRKVLEDLQSRLDCSTQPLASGSLLKKLGARMKWPITARQGIRIGEYSILIQPDQKCELPRLGARNSEALLQANSQGLLGWSSPG